MLIRTRIKPVDFKHDQPISSHAPISPHFYLDYKIQKLFITCGAVRFENKTKKTQIPDKGS